MDQTRVPNDYNLAPIAPIGKAAWDGAKNSRSRTLFSTKTGFTTSTDHMTACSPYWLWCLTVDRFVKIWLFWHDSLNDLKDIVETQAGLKQNMALKKVKGTLERVLDKNMQDLVRGIRNHKESEVLTKQQQPSPS